MMAALACLRLFYLFAIAVPSLNTVSAEVVDASRTESSPLHRLPVLHRKLQLAPSSNALPNRYIVQLDPAIADVSTKAEQLIQGTLAKIPFLYEFGIKGFAVEGLAFTFLFRLLRDNDVIRVEQVRLLVAHENTRASLSGIL